MEDPGQKPVDVSPEANVQRIADPAGVLSNLAKNESRPRSRFASTLLYLRGPPFRTTMSRVDDLWTVKAG